MTRRLILIRWSFYTAATIFLLLLQSQLLGRIVLWGVCPIVIPCIAAVTATREPPRHAVIFALVLGAVCDTLFAAPMPVLYLLTCLMAAVLSVLVARHLIMPGFRCSLVCCVFALLLSSAVGALTMLYGGAAFGTVVGIGLRESLISLPFALLLIHPLYTHIHRRTTS